MRVVSKRDLSLLVAAIVLCGFALELAATDGTFVGRIVDPSPEQKQPPGWIFVQGRNHMVRRVEVTHATIAFGQEVPVGQRRKCGPECLEAGQEVRVIAAQDSAGEWRAKRVEILRLAVGRPRDSASKLTKLYPGPSCSVNHHAAKLHLTAYGETHQSVTEPGI